MVTDNTRHNDESAHSWQENIITLFEQLSNFAFYILALFIIVIPPIKWLTDIFPSTDNGWWVMASIIVFVIIIPLLTELVANVSIIPLEKIRKGEFLSVIFKPLKSIFAVISIYGVMVLEYKVIHGQTDRTLFEVYCELLKSL